jgi:hypothetical protein
MKKKSCHPQALRHHHEFVIFQFKKKNRDTTGDKADTLKMAN